MHNLILESDPKVETVFNNYPDNIRDKMLSLRTLVIETAQEIKAITNLEETLKWGEPSYITKHGSTLRMDWKAKSPNQYALYFQCSSRLVETFRSLFTKQLKFEGNRAIIFSLDEEIPREIIKHCIKATLTYHKVKHLPALGI
jgi:hypothetical protein